MADFWRMTAVEIAALVRAKQASATEVTRDALARLDAVNPAINAVVDHRPDEALAEAARVDRAIAAGDDVGPLAGVPATVKINLDQAGFATTNGVALQRDLVAHEDNPVVANLRHAGAILIGRTNAPAFSLRWFTSNRLHGATKNPHDPRLTPGGSSGGAAAAVAAGIGAIALGTDIAGSIRYPAYACGIHGLRPSLGRIPAYNASLPERSIGPQLTAISGPLARTIADLRLALAALSQRDPRDPWWVPAPLAGPPVPKRAAVCASPEGLETAPEVRAALEEAAARLARAGWEVEAVETLPPLREPAELQKLIWCADGFADRLRLCEREGDAGALAFMTALQPLAETMDLEAFTQALTRRATLVREWQRYLDRAPLVLLPVSGELPFENDLDLAGREAFERVWRAQLTQLAVPFLGLPALAVSTGSVGSTPVGVQLVAGRYREDVCLEAAEIIEAGMPPVAIDPAGLRPAGDVTGAGA